MGMSEFRGAVDDRESIRTIRRVLDLGVAVLDTADIDGLGHNEIRVGEAVRGRRYEAVLSTKVGIVRTADPWERLLCGQRDYIRSRCDQSRRRLGIDHIDIYYQHRMNPATSVEQTMLAMAEFVTAGKVRHVGLSEVSPTTIRRAHAVNPMAAVVDLTGEIGPTAEPIAHGHNMAASFRVALERSCRVIPFADSPRRVVRLSCRVCFVC